MRGIVNGKNVEKYIINASISRVLSAANEWNKILDCASNPQLSIIISNTTEVGITLMDDRIDGDPPVSFPGKLLAFLYRRFEHFKGDSSKGMVIIPTELIPGNATALKMILRQLAEDNQMEPAFIAWLLNANSFCNSLVDRIVPGKLSPDLMKSFRDQMGYEDRLAFMSEIYGLWAIETKDEKVKQILSFQASDEGMVLAPDINIYRELKLRLLNGSHTLTCGLAFLAGFTTVKQAMEDDVFETFITRLMMNEIIPSITTEQLDKEQAIQFATSVLDRYRNPFMEHQWISITLQYTSKMGMRVIPLFKSYIKRYSAVPPFMALGFASWLLFMRSASEKDGKHVGERDGLAYPINDDQAALLTQLWKKNDIDVLVAEVLAAKGIWQEDIGQLPGLADTVAEKLRLLINAGPAEALRKHVSDLSIADNHSRETI